ncbi:DUF2267 domain-containing protein [Actinoallomurus soli]|uniref:DUF2267 domain-containing protein n=1 Tax=Actinoallomurus soli TaxID=2952535 RepID=UPI00209312DB|nr:DUF2267 domain-containing protein [Actinoallomurus soli]MCO5974102.1 DUF2267 domain-containing protein [Actinoallomurus soli]
MCRSAGGGPVSTSRLIEWRGNLMEFREFIRTVQRGAGLDADAAERAARATLTTLAERLSPGEARDLLEELPAEMKPWVYTESAAERFDIDEFLRRVAERAGVDVETAERHARAVFFALGRAVRADEIDDIAAELPQDFEPLIAEARHRFFTVMPSEEFLSRVAERTGLDIDGARRATEAVLTALAQRIAGGEVDDLIPRLPLSLHDPLRRGRAATGGRARRMSLDRFLQIIADREGIDRFAASEHARAVFATLREAVGDEEYFDVTVQLPPDYSVLLPVP